LVDAADPRTALRTWDIGDGSEMPAVDLPARELAQLRKKGHRSFNLSRDESERLRGAASDAEALALYREVLAERVEAYRTGGLSGIAPYQRGKRGAVDPAAELSEATDLVLAATPSADTFGALSAVLESSAGGVPAGDDAHLLQLVEKTVQDRVHHGLSHLMFVEASDALIIVERQFYSSHSYDALQLIVGLAPFEGGTLVAVFGHTATDRVAGVGSGLAKSIGRKRSVQSYDGLAALIRDAILELR
ncbi:MAG: hypothetical protein AAFX85_20835, partial [Pseudomonadota bacterium]